MKRFALSASTGLAIGVGTVALLALFLPGPMFASLRWLFLDWAILLSGVALFAAFVYFLQSQWKLILARRSGWGYRVLMILAAMVAFTATLLQPQGGLGAWLLHYVLIPGGAALLGLMAVFVTYRGLWMVFRRGRGWGWAFAGLVVLLLALDLYRGWHGPGTVADGLTYWIEGVVARAGLRGLLLGMALGLMATGIRLLGGVDRPYEE